MQIEYTNWNGERKTWGVETAHYYLLLDSTVYGTDGSYFSYSAPFYSQTIDGVRTAVNEWLARFPAYTLDLFRASGAKIVKAPCAFDARENHVFVELL